MLMNKKVLQEKKKAYHYIGSKTISVWFILISFSILAWICYWNGTFNPANFEPYIIHYPLGSVGVFVLLYALAVFAAVPSLPLNLAAGFFWGGVLGGIYTTVSVTIGAWFAFSTARSLAGQPFKKNFDHKWISKVQEEFDKNGWLFVAFARVNPIIPTAPLNFILGLTSISSRAFLLATFVFLLPSSIAIAYIGFSLKTIVAAQTLRSSEMLQVTFIISLVLTCLIGLRFASKILKKT